jgi:hypothetical protein
MDTESAKRAAVKAVEFFREMHPDKGISDVEVEEIELSADESEWSVTIGYARPLRTYTAEARLRRLLNPAENLIQAKERDYKRITLRAGDLQVLRMTIREPVA